MGNIEKTGDVGARLGEDRGVVGRGALAEAGLARGALRRRVASGEYLRVHRGTYVHAAIGESAERDVRVALVRLGNRYCASHATAAHLHGLLRYPPADTHVARREHWGNHARRPGMVVHRAPGLGDREITVVDGIRVTTVERTLLDMAAACRGVIDRKLLRYAVKAALKEDDALAARLERRVADRAGKRGTRILRDALDEWVLTGPARSLTELDFVDFCRDHDIPLPRTNIVIAGYERDAAWVDPMVIAEVDTRAHHDDAVAFEVDRDRLNSATDAGWKLVQITPRAMTIDGAKTAARLHRLVGRASSS